MPYDDPNDPNNPQNNPQLMQQLLASQTPAPSPNVPGADQQQSMNNPAISAIAQSTANQNAPPPPPTFSGDGGNDTSSTIGAMVNSLASARGAPALAPQNQFTYQAPQAQQGAPQVPRPGMPNLVQFIGGLLNPSSPRFNPVGSATGARAPVFENFIANTLYSLGQGFANEGHGPGAAFRGFGSALTAPYQRDVNTFQLQQQSNENQARIGQQQAQTGLVEAQTVQSNLESEMLRNRIKAMQGFDPQSVLAPLGALSGDEQALVNTAQREAALKGDVSPILEVTKTITNQRAISGRAGPRSIVVDADSSTGYSQVTYDRGVKNILDVTRNIPPPPGMAPVTNAMQHIVKGPDNTYQVVTLTGTKTPNLPGAKDVVAPTPGPLPPPGSLPGSLLSQPPPAGNNPAAQPAPLRPGLSNLINQPQRRGAGGGSVATRPPGGGGGPVARPILDANGNPLHAPLSQVAKTTISQIRSAEGLMDLVKPDLESVAADIGRGGNLPDTLNVRSAWAQYQKLGIDPANVDTGSLVNMLPNVDPRLARMLPTIAMLQVVGSQPYLKGIRRYEFIRQIQQHIPDPEKDTPQLMVAKLRNMAQTLPIMEKAIFESEGFGNGGGVLDQLNKNKRGNSGGNTTVPAGPHSDIGFVPSGPR